MTTNDTVSVWGCVVCSHIAMQGDRLLDGVFAVLWLMFAIWIVWAARRDSKKSTPDATSDAGDARDG